MPSPNDKTRCYRFGEHTLSLAERRLRRGGCDVPLIPRYFDLLVLLVERRAEAVHRDQIRDLVWSDVVVSDGALSQAVRTLRRALDDDPREPRYIRTVSRHGYQFIFPDVTEESPPACATMSSAQRSEVRTQAPTDQIEQALAELLAPDRGPEALAAQQEAAERLHLLGTAEALERLDRRPGHSLARAILRDSRWDVPGAGPVPLLGAPGAVAAALHLLRLRLLRVWRPIEERWAVASAGGGMAGVLAGLLGGLTLCCSPGSRASAAVPVVLALLGAAVGSVGAAGVGAGLALAEGLFRSARGVALVVLGAAGGGTIGAAAHLLARWLLTSLFGRDFSPLGGGFEGLTIGAGVGLGYALATDRAAGMATPRRWQRLTVAATTGLTGALAAAFLGATGRHLGALSLDLLARSFPGSQVSLDPLARLLGEPTAGPLTRMLISAGEGLFFGAGLALGLTRRPRQG